MKLRTSLFAALLLTAASVPVATAEWVHQENSVFRAEKASQKHPKTLEQTLVLPRAAAEAQLCVAYGRDTSSPNKGRVVTTIDVLRANGSSQRLRIKSSIANNAAMRCRTFENLRAGAAFTFQHQFKKMPRVRTTGNGRQSVVVAGIVSSVGRPRFADGVLALVPDRGAAPLGLKPGSRGGWFHSANSVLHAGTDGRRHPATLTRAIVVPQDTGASPLVCAGYDRSIEVEGAGRVVTKARIARADGIERLNLTGRVVDNLFLSCKNAKKKISAGDIVSFEATYEEMPALAKGAFTDLISAVSATGAPAFPPRPVIEIPQEPEETVNEDDPEDDGGPPAPGSSLSVADEYAATRLLGGRDQQLVHMRSHVPTKYMVMATATRLNPDGSVVPSTVGFGNDIETALADYERKQGSLGGSGRRLSSSERSSMEYFARLNPSGPTAIRKDRAGGFHGDVYRPWLGVVQGGVFGSIEATVNWFKSIGL